MLPAAVVGLLARAADRVGAAGPRIVGCGREWITISILDGRPHPVWIYIDGRGPLGPNIVNTYRVTVGTHVVYWVYADGTRTQNDTVNVPTCGYALIRLN